MNFGKTAIAAALALFLFYAILILSLFTFLRILSSRFASAS